MSTKVFYSRALATVSVIALLSLFFGIFIALTANDVYAFIKPEGQYTLRITEQTSLFDLSQELNKNRIISNPYIFSAYVRIKNKESILTDYKGELTLRKNMSYREIINEFSKK